MKLYDDLFYLCVFSRPFQCSSSAHKPYFTKDHFAGAYQRGKVRDEHLHESGRYFAYDYTDLTQCYHGETGNYRNSAGGKAVALLNLWQTGALDKLAHASTPAWRA